MPTCDCVICACVRNFLTFIRRRNAKQMCWRGTEASKPQSLYDVNGGVSLAGATTTHPLSIVRTSDVSSAWTRLSERCKNPSRQKRCRRRARLLRLALSSSHYVCALSCERVPSFPFLRCGKRKVKKKSAVAPILFPFEYVFMLRVKTRRSSSTLLAFDKTVLGCVSSMHFMCASAHIHTHTQETGILLHASKDAQER